MGRRLICILIGYALGALIAWLASLVFHTRIVWQISLLTGPVVLELWPAHDRGTVMIMTPRRRVITSRRYFRIGNTALDRLTAQLAVSSAGELP